MTSDDIIWHQMTTDDKGWQQMISEFIKLARVIDIFKYWNIETLDDDLLEYWEFGILRHCNIEKREYWDTGILRYGNNQILEDYFIWHLLAYW